VEKSTYDDIYKAFLVPIKGFDSDSGGEFINQYFRNTARNIKSILRGAGRGTAMTIAL